MNQDDMPVTMEGKEPAPQPQCLITGCDLCCSRYGTVYHGDLFLYGEMYIFNAVTHIGGAAIMERPVQRIHLSLDLSENSYFERRGVFTMHEAYVTLSQAAKDYIHGKPL